MSETTKQQESSGSEKETERRSRSVLCVSEMVLIDFMIGIGKIYLVLILMGIAFALSACKLTINPQCAYECHVQSEVGVLQ